MSLFAPHILLIFVLLGSFSGFVAGFLGIGGGVILVPLFLWAFTLVNLPSEILVHLAFGTSLAIIFPTAISSVLAHRKRGNVDWAQVAPLAGGGIAGAMAGAFCASLISGEMLKALFGLMQMGIGLRMLFSRRMHQDQQGQPCRARLILIGLSGGLFSSFFGVGGGVVAVPAMVLFYLIFGYANPLLPAFSLGYVHLLVFLVVAPLTILFARFGAAAASKLSHRRLLQAFALLLILVGARMLWSFLG